METQDYIGVLNALTDDEKEKYSDLHALRLTQIKKGFKKPLKDLELEERLGRYNVKEGLIIEGEKNHMLFWKKPAYMLSENGKSQLKQEISKIESVSREVKDLEEYQIEGIIKSQGYNTMDFLIRKMILVDGIFDYNSYGIFKNKKLGDYLDERFSLNERGEDFDFISTFLILDILSDGALHFDIYDEFNI